MEGGSRKWLNGLGETLSIIREEVRASKESSDMGGGQKQLREPQTRLRALEPVVRVSEQARRASEETGQDSYPAG